jgi:HAE1 family hydrophobic/amphiphilic exporter-1
MFRQFALVIASTAIISALNALTLKPTQCALYLKPVAKDRKVNWFYRGFNAAYQAVEDVYVGLVSRMAHHSGAMACLFVVVVGMAGLLFANHPTAFLPTEDQGYCIVVARLPPGASQPRVREVADSIDSILKQIAGVKGWVTSGGFSALDSANLSNVVTEYVMYQSWDERPDLPQAKIVSDIRSRLRAIRKADCSVLIPPPIPGLGQTGGFQMMVEDRGGTGLHELGKAAQQLIHEADREPELRGVTTTFSASSPQLYLEINRTMVESLGVTINDVFLSLQTYLGSTYVNQFNKFNQSFQVRVQAGPDYRRELQDISNLYVANRDGQMVPLGAMLSVRRMLGSELLTRYNLYPAVPIIGSAAPGFSSGQALDTMGRVATRNLPLKIDYDWTGLSYQEKLIGSQAYFILRCRSRWSSWCWPASTRAGLIRRR